MACFLLVLVTTVLARVAGLVLLLFAVGDVYKRQDPARPLFSAVLPFPPRPERLFQKGG